MYAVQKLSKYSRNMLVMKCWSDAGALVSPKGIAMYSKLPKQERKELFHCSPLAFLTKLLAPRSSNLVNPFPLNSRISVSGISGRGYRFFTVLSLIPRWSTHQRRYPSPFLMNITKARAGDELAQMNSLESFFSMDYLSAISLSRAIPYRVLNGCFLPCARGMACS